MVNSIIKFVQLTVASGLLEAVLLPDGRQGATLRSLCALLQIDRSSQLARIKHNHSLAAGLVLVNIELPDETRTLNVVLSNYIALFVATLHVSKLAPAAQETALILQTKAVQTIANAFDASPMAAEAPTTVATPTSRSTETTPPPSFDRIIAGMEEMIEGFSELRDDHFSLIQRVGILEQANLGSRAIGGGRLSAQQIGQLFLQLQLLRQQTGISIEEAEKRLAEEFKVAHITDIDASKWPALTRAIQAIFNR